MLDINLKMPPLAADQLPSLAQIKAWTTSISKKGTMAIFSPDALKLSPELEATKNDPDKNPAVRMDASVELRQLAAQILNAK
jgi:hypothetical protein